MLSSQQIVKLGLGEAVQRLLHVEAMYRAGIGELPDQLLEERKLLLEAMNHIRIEIAFDCNGDGIPDTVEIFHKTAGTSCCRLHQYESSGKKPTAVPSMPDKKPRASSGRESSLEAGDLAKNPKKKTFGLF